MALRLLPFRQYDEHDVINGFYINPTNAEDAIKNPDLDDINANGVIVYAQAHDMNLDNIRFINNPGGNNFLEGKQHSSPVGRNGYPYHHAYVNPVDSHTERPIGITLNQTLTYDENGQPLQYYPQKLDELQAVLPYKPVPIASKGIFTLSSNAFYTGDTFAPGTPLMAANAASPKAGIFMNRDESIPIFRGEQIGVVLATGSRAAGDAYAGNYYIIKLDCT